MERNTLRANSTQAFAAASTSLVSTEARLSELEANTLSRSPFLTASCNKIAPSSLSCCKSCETEKSSGTWNRISKCALQMFWTAKTVGENACKDITCLEMPLWCTVLTYGKDFKIQNIETSCTSKGQRARKMRPQRILHLTKQPCHLAGLQLSHPGPAGWCWCYKLHSRRKKRCKWTKSIQNHPVTCNWLSRVANLHVLQRFLNCKNCGGECKDITCLALPLWCTVLTYEKDLKIQNIETACTSKGQRPQRILQLTKQPCHLAGLQLSHPGPAGWCWCYKLHSRRKKRCKWTKSIQNHPVTCNWLSRVANLHVLQRFLNCKNCGGECKDITCLALPLWCTVLTYEKDLKIQNIETSCTSKGQRPQRILQLTKQPCHLAGLQLSPPGPAGWCWCYKLHSRRKKRCKWTKSIQNHPVTCNWLSRVANLHVLQRFLNCKNCGGECKDITCLALPLWCTVLTYEKDLKIQNIETSCTSKGQRPQRILQLTKQPCHLAGLQLSPPGPAGWCWFYKLHFRRKKRCKWTKSIQNHPATCNWLSRVANLHVLQRFLNCKNCGGECKDITCLELPLWCTVLTYEKDLKIQNIGNMENVKRICTPSLHLHSTNVKIWPCRRAAALQLCCLDIYQPWKIAQSQDPNSLQSMWATEKYCSSTIRVSLSLYIFLLSIYIYI